MDAVDPTRSSEAEKSRPRLSYFHPDRVAATGPAPVFHTAQETQRSHFSDRLIPLSHPTSHSSYGPRPWPRHPSDILAYRNSSPAVYPEPLHDPLVTWPTTFVSPKFDPLTGGVVSLSEPQHQSSQRQLHQNGNHYTGKAIPENTVHDRFNDPRTRVPQFLNMAPATLETSRSSMLRLSSPPITPSPKGGSMSGLPDASKLEEGRCSKENSNLTLPPITDVRTKPPRPARKSSVNARMPGDAVLTRRPLLDNWLSRPTGPPKLTGSPKPPNGVKLRSEGLAATVMSPKSESDQVVKMATDGSPRTDKVGVNKPTEEIKAKASPKSLEEKKEDAVQKVKPSPASVSLAPTSPGSPMIIDNGPRKEARNNRSPRATPQKAPPRTKSPRRAQLDLEVFERALRALLREMRADHEYYVKSNLARARALNRASLTKKAPPNAKGRGANYIQTNSPFEDIKPLAELREASSTKNGKTGKFGHWVGRSAKEHYHYHQTPFTHATISIPPCTNYISTKRNILVEDDKHRTFLPYNGDDFAVGDDKEYARLETKIEKNRTIYHASNALAEKATVSSQYAIDFLHAVGTDVPNVLYFLLNDKDRLPPSELPTDLAWVWLERIEHLKDGYFEQSEDTDVTKKGRQSADPRPKRQWRTLFEKLPDPGGWQQAAASIACIVFLRVTGFSLWQIVSSSQYVADTLSLKYTRSTGEDTFELGFPSTPGTEPNPLGTYAELICLVCKAHECPGHGGYEDEDDEKNVRLRVVRKPDSPNSPKRRGSKSTLNKDRIRLPNPTPDDIIGLNENKSVTGTFWNSVQDLDSPYSDEITCSEQCFWLKSNRSEVTPSVWTNEDRRTLELLRPGYENDRRGSCMLSQLGLMQKTCVEIFLKIFETAPCETLYSYKAHNEAVADKDKVPQRKPLDFWLENPNTANTFMHHQRLPFTPCNHPGPCNEASNCECFNEKINCEKSCACADNCRRRFRGCRCAQKGKVCRNNEKCDCFRLNRECDPDLCRSCGAHEVLDPANRHRDDIAQGKCANVYLQRGVPKRTLLGHSKMMASYKKSGWGLYMGEPCKKGDYIGEYVGEIISDLEAEQRGAIYDKRNCSYLFSLNGSQTLDSTLMGNKLRFINHQPDSTANCQAKTLFCNLVQRIGMFAIKDIEVGDEIFFNYGDGFASKFDLIILDSERNTPSAEPSAAAAVTKSPYGNRAKYFKNTFSKNGLRIGRPPKHPEFLPGPESSREVSAAAPPASPRSGLERRARKRRLSEIVETTTAKHRKGRDRSATDSTSFQSPERARTRQPKIKLVHGRTRSGLVSEDPAEDEDEDEDEDEKDENEEEEEDEDEDEEEEEDDDDDDDDDENEDEDEEEEGEDDGEEEEADQNEGVANFRERLRRNLKREEQEETDDVRPLVWGSRRRKH